MLSLLNFNLIRFGFGFEFRGKGLVVGKLIGVTVYGPSLRNINHYRIQEVVGRFEIWLGLVSWLRLGSLLGLDIQYQAVTLGNIFNKCIVADFIVLGVNHSLVGRVGYLLDVNQVV